mgnify:CR=1 FL=1
MGNFSLSRVGVDNGQLLDTDLIYLDEKVVEAVEQALVARRVFAPVRLPHAGVKTWTVNVRGIMNTARVDMDGLNASFDRTKKTAHSVSVPVIHKEYLLPWRDIIASRAAGMPIDVSEPEDAAKRVAVEENFMCLTGETTAHRLLGIQGLATATSRNTEASAGAWSTATNAIQDVSDAIAELEADGHNGPYALICRSDMAADLRLLIANTGMLCKEKILQMVNQIYVSDALYASNDAVTSALVVEPGPQNFELGIAQEVTNFTWQDKDMNTLGKVYEVVVPHIKRPTSICEITGITA